MVPFVYIWTNNTISEYSKISMDNSFPFGVHLIIIFKYLTEVVWVSDIHDRKLLKLLRLTIYNGISVTNTLKY